MHCLPEQDPLQHCRPQKVSWCRIDAPIYFANVEWIRGRINKYRMRANRDPALGPVFFVILDMAPVPFVDSTGAPAPAHVDAVM